MSSVTHTELYGHVGPGPLVITKGRVRALADDDLDQITALIRTAGERGVSAEPSSVKRLFFDSPWRDAAMPSLGYEDAQGRLIGCVGVMPRPMKFCGHPIRAAVGHHFVVEPTRAGMRAGIELVRHFLKGPQDLSLTASDDVGRRVWTSLGGSVAPLHSFSWTRPLRSSRCALEVSRKRELPRSAAATLHHAWHAIDATLNFFTGRRFQIRSAALSDDLDEVTMLACLSSFVSDRALQPSYDIASLGWLLETLAGASDRTHFHKVTVRTQSGRPLGWYLYYLHDSGAAEVLQVGGKEDGLPDVLHHLFEHAHDRGAIAITGPMDERLVRVLSENDCVFRTDRSWTLIHSRDHRIVDAIHVGDAFMSKLEGARWVEPAV